MAREKSSGSLVDLVTLDNPITTDFRRLLFHIRNSAKEREIKTVLITSATVGEGKSTVSALLAITAARKGLRTLIVDTDLRRSVQHSMFDLERSKGVVELLVDGIQVRNAVKKARLDKLDLITSGRSSSAPAEIFDAPRIGSILNELKFFYDLIIVDSPPVLPVTEPMALAEEVDGVILVLKLGETDRRLVMRAVDILRSTNGHMLGLVLNNVKQALPSYYDYSSYEYYPTPLQESSTASSRANEADTTAVDSDTPDSEAKKNSLLG